MSAERRVTLAPDGQAFLVSLSDDDFEHLIEPVVYILKHWAALDFARMLGASEEDTRAMLGEVTAAMAEARRDGLQDRRFDLVVPDRTLMLFVAALWASLTFWDDPTVYPRVFGWTRQEADALYRDVYAPALKAKEPPPPPGPDGVEVPASDVPLRPTTIFDDDPQGTGRPWIDPGRLSITDPEERRRIADFLDRGSFVMAGLFLMPDELDPSRGDVVPVGDLTDGVWLWSAGLAYYVREHGLSPEPEFLQHMADHDWKTPAPTDERVLQALAQVEAENQAWADARRAGSQE